MDCDMRSIRLHTHTHPRARNHPRPRCPLLLNRSKAEHNSIIVFDQGVLVSPCRLPCKKLVTCACARGLLPCAMASMHDYPAACQYGTMFSLPDTCWCTPKMRLSSFHAHLYLWEEINLLSTLAKRFNSCYLYHWLTGSDSNILEIYH